MKTTTKIHHKFLTATILLFALLIPEAANAAWSKASAKFTCDGVSVQVVDRRDKIGRSHSNTYGYADYKNKNDVKVTVNWRCFGVLKDSHKLVLLNDDSFDLAPGEKRGEVYSYRAGRYQYKDFEKYVVSIEVIKDKPQVDIANEDLSGDLKKSDKTFARLMKLKNSGEYTQQDYSEAIDWLTRTFNSKLKPVYDDCFAALDRNDQDEAERLSNQIMPLANQWEELCKFIKSEDDAKKLNESNHKKFMKLSVQVVTTIK